ncbi:MAG: metallophosphoesterase family protein [Candidatus Krumholzibacteriia bacterium]
MHRDGTAGVISDTHGLLRRQAVDALRGVDLIIHAGDVGDESILASLAEIAPVRAIRGNMDRQKWAESLPATDVVEFGARLFYVLHDLGTLDVDPAAAGFRCVISGHTHRPSLTEEGGVLYLNPGSAGPRRFDLPVSVARIDVAGDDVTAAVIELDTPGAE